ncbi:MAG: VWA domain-containing protein [Acidobacteria bacterium]|nr:VWA domain-containing protein [Acidobacteriota bacterium]MBI3263963.1 VWA domain-containing protein [Acidobacteriota bacterium]
MTTLMVAAAAVCGVTVEMPAVSRAQIFHSGVDVVYVNATVTDSNGRLVQGLARDDFVIYEEGVEQPVTQFTGERVPVSLGLLLDASDSMLGAPMRDLRLAVDRFLVDLLPASDEAFILAFNHRPYPVATWNSPPSRVAHTVEAIRPWGGTAIYDALVAAMPMFGRRQHQRAATVVISDGADTASDTTLADVRSAFHRSDAFLYAIAIDVPDKRRSARVRPEALKELTDASGGYTEVIHSTQELGDATARIADELNHQYTLGYVAPRPADGTYRSIRVKVKTAGYFVRARRGYVAVARRLP